MKNSRILVILVAASLNFISCNKKEVELSDPLVTNRDTLVNPADDFFKYANGGWFKKNPIPSTEQSNGIFRTIADTINNQIKQICEKSAQDDSAEKGSNKQKIGDFYASGMDTIAINKAGISPLKSEFAKIDAIKDVPSLVNSIAHLHTIGASPAFSFYLGQDDKISTKYALFLGQGGLGLGNRDYYFNTDEQTVKIRTEYVKHLQAMLKLIGQNEASATSIMKLETDLAKASRKLEDLRDPIKNYNKMTIASLGNLSPNFNWNSMFPVLGVAKAESVIVGQPEFYNALNTIVKSYSIEDWKSYLKWDLVNTYAAYLNSDIEKQNFKFYSTVMNGVSKQKPRWKRVVGQTDNYLGELIGQVYVAEYLPKGSKEKLLEIGNNIRDVYADHIKKLDWMSEATKVKALKKLSKIVMKVGYPDKWKDMSSMKIDRNSYCVNVIQANIWSYKDMINKYGKPVDRTEWSMTLKPITPIIILAITKLLFLPVI
jgi:putative endopeptidase